MSLTNSPFELRGTFVVTGGTRGIGRAISERFARSGARIIANYVRNEKAAQELHAGAAQEGLPITICRADLTTADGLTHIETQVRQSGAPLAGSGRCQRAIAHRRWRHDDPRLMPICTGDRQRSDHTEIPTSCKTC